MFGGCVPAEVPSRLSETSAGRVSYFQAGIVICIETSTGEVLLRLLPVSLLPLGIKIAQKPYIVWSLGPKALIYESLEP